MSNGKTVSWHQAAAWPLVIISGPETYFASRAIRQIKNQLRVEHRELEVSEVAEGEYSPGLLFSLAAPSLFNEPRLVVIQSASEGLLEDIQSLMSDPAQNCTIVIRTPNLVGQNGKVKKELASLALNISCDEVKKDSDRIDFINREFKTFGIPSVIVSDGGPHFKNSLIQLLARELTFEHHLTLAHSPWANGSVERLNRSMLAYFRK